jgi:hypothetical protein
MLADWLAGNLLQPFKPLNVPAECVALNPASKGLCSLETLGQSMCCHACTLLLPLLLSLYMDDDDDDDVQTGEAVGDVPRLQPPNLLVSPRAECFDPNIYSS